MKTFNDFARETGILEMAYLLPPPGHPADKPLNHKLMGRTFLGLAIIPAMKGHGALSVEEIIDLIDGTETYNTFSKEEKTRAKVGLNRQISNAIEKGLVFRPERGKFELTEEGQEAKEQRGNKGIKSVCRGLLSALEDAKISDETRDLVKAVQDLC